MAEPDPAKNEIRGSSPRMTMFNMVTVRCFV